MTRGERERRGIGERVRKLWHATDTDRTRTVGVKKKKTAGRNLQTWLTAANRELDRSKRKKNKTKREGERGREKEARATVGTNEDFSTAAKPETKRKGGKGIVIGYGGTNRKVAGYKEENLRPSRT